MRSEKYIITICSNHGSKKTMFSFLLKVDANPQMNLPDMITYLQGLLKKKKKGLEEENLLYRPEQTVLSILGKELFNLE